MSNPRPIRLLTVKEFLERRRGSRSSLYLELRIDPDMPRPIKIGRRTYFVEEEVESWLQEKVQRARAGN
ncbi:helix-turn-helix transcriptional regulator [Thermomonas sp.]|uniref:helix-turn-helix transcriptional regulator n=1 Tax=Thermomonas sp. TaxID=1971895 RepID=UPI0035B25FE7